MKRFGVMAWAAAQSAPAAKPKLAISDLRAKAVREPASGRSYVVVTLVADGGIRGFGEAPARPDPATAVAAILRWRQHLIGKDALSAGVVDTGLMNAAAAQAADVAGVRAAVNMALFDILGKVTKASVTEVAGGTTRNKLRAMAVIPGASVDQLKDGVRKAKSAGHRAFSVPIRMPDVPTRGRHFYREVHAMLDELRKAGGEDTDFVLDCDGKTTAGEALVIAADLEKFHLIWLDEPTADINQQSLAELAQRTVTPMGYGRNITNNSRFQDLLGLGAIDVLRPDITRNSLTSVRKAAALADTYYVAMSPYNRGGPVATAAALHIGATFPNYYIQEVPFAMDDRDAKMREELIGRRMDNVTEGYFALPPGPGLGVDIKDEVLAKYEVRS